MSKKKKLILLPLVALLIILASRLVSWAGDSVSTTTANPVSVLSEQSVPSVKTISGKHFTSSMPGNLTIKTHSTQPKGIAIEQLMAANSNPKLSDQLAITVGRLPHDGLAGLGDVKLRQQPQGTYEPLQLEAAPGGALAFTKKNGFEKSIFWAKDGRYAAVVVSGQVDRADILSATLSQVVGGWQWR